jgi:hypothetical protein
MTVTARGGQTPQRRAERVTLRRSGFDQTEVTLEASVSQLAVRDRSGLQEVMLRLEDESGHVVRQGRAGRKRPYWRVQGELAPGSYLLTVVSRPDWVCRVTVLGR